MTELQELRKKIEKIDKQLSILLKKRLSVIKKIGSLKAEKSLQIMQSEREKKLINKIIEICNTNKECEQFLTSIFKNVYKESRSIQKKQNREKGT